MKRRDFLYSTATAALSTLPGFLPVVHAQSPAARGALTFLTPAALSLAYAPVMYGAVAGLFAKEGLDMRIDAGRGGAQILQLAAARQVDMARTGGINYLMARVDGQAPVIAFGTVAQRSPFAVISPRDAPLLTPEALAGKTIGLQSAGGSMEAALDLMLLRARIDGKALRRARVVDSPASISMIESRRVDGFLANTSTAANLVAQGHPVAVMKIDDGVPGQVFVAEESMLAANRAGYVAFMHAIYLSTQALIAMDDAGLRKAIELMRARFDVPGARLMPVALADLRANRELWLTSDPRHVLRNDEKRWADAEQLLRQAGLLKSPSTRAPYTNDIWDAANPA
ncbi:NMT1/THI5 like protein [Pigmentiphaga humi]|uniref:NMT1/THI5 like protein n=1 Tax=Pigmentiphaga humi TaxID=2478468 RepID=A0A3P4B7K3_9BURK|nr:ABC transporter substrate-binding protein [Pigmentiphaga humi]VCU71668.1 NMT1/THI5 like protein [Pigmentiphaga humi]